MTIDQFISGAGGKVEIYRGFHATAEREISGRVVVCVPDLHLLECDSNDDFLDNHPEYVDRFTAFLDFLLERKEVMQDGLEVIQLGDMFDLWQARGNTNLIYSAYPNILGLIDELKPVYLVGNHDIDLLRFHKGETYDRVWRHFTKNSGGDVTVLFEHGFQADFFNNQGSWSGVIGRGVTEIIGLAEYLEPDVDVILEDLWKDISRTFNLYNAGLTPVRDRERFNTHEYINYYLRLMERYNRGETDDHMPPADLLLSVVGHTHTVRLVSRPGGKTTFYLMDCGSWVNGGHEFGVISGREMAVCRWES